MWIRNTAENHGNIFNDCTFKGLGENAVIARMPVNHGQSYPYSESVLLNCTLDGVPSIGFAPVAEPTVTLLEFNSHDKDDKAIDVSQRHHYVRQLDPIKDAELIGKYADASWVLNW